MADLRKLAPHIYGKIENLTQRQFVPGLTVYIETAGESGGVSWGLGDIAPQTPMHKDFLFHAGSMVRPVANHLLLQHADASIALSEPGAFNGIMQRYGVSAPSPALRHLLENTSGLTDVNVLDPQRQEAFDPFTCLSEMRALYAPGKFKCKNHLAGLVVNAIYERIAGAPLGLDEYFRTYTPGHEHRTSPVVQGWSKDYCFQKNILQIPHVDHSRASPTDLDESFWGSTLSSRTFTVREIARMFKSLARHERRPQSPQGGRVLHVCGRKTYFPSTETGLGADGKDLRFLVDDFSAETFETKYLVECDVLIAVGTNCDYSVPCSELIDYIQYMLLGTGENKAVQDMAPSFIRPGIYLNRLGYKIAVSRSADSYAMRFTNTPYFNRDDMPDIAVFTVEDGHVQLLKSCPGVSVSMIYDDTDSGAVFVVDGDLYVNCTDC